MEDPKNELGLGSIWLLQSGKFDPQILAEALTFEYYPFLYQFALFFVDNSAQAETAVRQALEDAVVYVSQYTDTISVQAWLIQFLIKALHHKKVYKKQSVILPSMVSDVDAQTFLIAERLNNSHRDLFDRAACMLAFYFNWPADEIAQALGWKEPEVHNRLVAMRNVIGSTSGTLGLPFDDLRTGLEPEKNSSRSDSETTSNNPDMLISSGTLELIAAQLNQNISTRLAHQQRLNRIQESLLIGFTILAALWIFRGINNLLPDVRNIAPLIPPGYTSRNPSTALWENNVAYVVDYGDTLESIAFKSGNSIETLIKLNNLSNQNSIYPGRSLWVSVPDDAPPTSSGQYDKSSINQGVISTRSDIASIRAFLRSSPTTWETLWVDYQIASLTIQNQSEHSDFYRFQAWINQPNRSNELFGDLSGEPMFRHIILNGRSYNSAVRYSIAYLDPSWIYPPETLIFSPLMREFFFPKSPELLDNELGELAVIGDDLIAGRKAIVLSWRSQDGSRIVTYWIDAATGILLRRIEDDPGNRLHRDIIATQVVYDAALPESVFDPRLTWREGFSENPNIPDLQHNPRLADPTPAFPPAR